MIKLPGSTASLTGVRKSSRNYLDPDLKNYFSFELLYYHEGLVPCKYGDLTIHGDSFIACRRKIKKSFHLVTKTKL